MSREDIFESMDSVLPLLNAYLQSRDHRLLERALSAVTPDLAYPVTEYLKEQGNQAFLEANYETALIFYQQAAFISPKDEKIQANLSFVMLRLGLFF